MFKIEFIPLNIPAKIFSSPMLTRKWMAHSMFKGLVEDQYEGMVVAAAAAGLRDDVKNLYYEVSSSKGKIGLAKSIRVTRHVARYTLSQRIKQVVSQEDEEGVARKEEAKEARAIHLARVKYVNGGIAKGIELHMLRMRERHFRIP